MKYETLQFKGALFDLDGVLIDTETIYTTFWHEINLRYPTGVERFEYVIKGNTLEQILQRYFPDTSTHPGILEMLREQEAGMKYELFPGVREYLDHLKSQGIPAAIITSSNPAKMAKVFGQIPGFRDYFRAVLTDRDVKRSKPDPDGYLRGAEALGLSPADCCVFEDSFAGLEAGRRSGARVVALATTNPAESLAPLADLVIPSFHVLMPEG